VRSVDLALYADELAARAATLAARLERARGRLRQAGIEREARRALGESSVARLESLGLLRAGEPAELGAEIRGLTALLAAVEDLQTWVERCLFEAGDQAALSGAGARSSESGRRGDRRPRRKPESSRP
jgi:hypothetical protein